MQTQNKFILYCALPFLVVLSYSSNVYFLPALPMIAHLLHATDAQEKLAFPLLLLGSSISCLFIGALADAYGAKKVMAAQIAVMLIGVIICIGAHSMASFLLGTFVQGLGVCSVVLIKYIELFEPKRTSKVLSVYFIAGCFFIPIVMTFSGHLCHFYAWVDVFWFWLVVVLMAFILTCCFPDYSAAESFKLNMKSYYSSIISYWGNWSFYAVLVLCMSIGGSVAVFYTLSPHIIILDFQKTPKQYGLLMIIPVIGRLIGNSLYFFLTGRISVNRILALGKWVACIAMMSYVVVYQFLPSPVVLMTFVGGLMIAYPMIRISSMLKVIAINPMMAGTALAFLTLGVKTVKGVSGLFAARQDGEMMGLLMLIIVVVGALLHTIIHRLDIRSQKKA